MTGFYVRVKIMAPYPFDSEHTIETSSPSAAASRAIREARKKITHKRRITSYHLEMRRISTRS